MSSGKIENYQVNNLFNFYSNPVSEDETSKKETEEVSIFNQNDMIKTDKSAPAIGFWGNIFGKIIDFFDKETKDGKIGNTKQIGTGDCWLLSGINAINSTEKGRQIIKDALEYETDDKGKITGTIVHFKGASDVYVSSDEVAKTKGSLLYASGDDDMIALELATEKIYDKLANNEISYSLDTPLSITTHNKATKFLASSLEGGMISEIMYLLTGKVTDSTNSEDEKNQILDKFINNKNKDYALAASINGDWYDVVKDYNNHYFLIAGEHAYSIKSADDNTVTVVNPWNSAKEIVFERNEFINVFTLTGIDLSDDNPEENYISFTNTESKILEDGTYAEYITDKDGNKIQDCIWYDKNKKQIKEITQYGRKNSLGWQWITTMIYNKFGEPTSKKSDICDSAKLVNQHIILYGNSKRATVGIQKNYYDNGTVSYITVTEDKPDGSRSQEMSNYDSEGNFIRSVQTKFDRRKNKNSEERITDYDILENKYQKYLK